MFKKIDRLGQWTKGTFEKFIRPTSTFVMFFAYYTLGVKFDQANVRLQRLSEKTIARAEEVRADDGRSFEEVNRRKEALKEQLVRLEALANQREQVVQERDRFVRESKRLTKQTRIELLQGFANFVFLNKYVGMEKRPTVKKFLFFYDFFKQPGC